jgi:hypothetical protein
MEERTQGSASGLEDAVAQVMEAARQKARELTAAQPHLQMWEAMQGFAHAIDWSERFILSLLAAQASLLLLTLATRRHTTLQTCVFGMAGELGAEKPHGASPTHDFKTHPRCTHLQSASYTLGSASMPLELDTGGNSQPKTILTHAASSLES